MRGGQVGGQSRQWQLAVKPLSPSVQGGRRGRRVQDLLGERRDGVEGAAIHPAGAVLLAESRVPPAVVPADRQVSIPTSVSPHAPPLHGVGMGVALAQAASMAATDRPRVPSCPLPVFVGAEYGLQQHTFFFNGSLGMGGVQQRGLGWTQTPGIALSLTCPPAPSLLAMDEPCHPLTLPRALNAAG